MKFERNNVLQRCEKEEEQQPQRLKRETGHCCCPLNFISGFIQCGAIMRDAVKAGDDEMQSTHLSLFPVRRLPAGLRVTDSVFWNSKHDKAGFWHCNSKAAAEEDLECVT